MDARTLESFGDHLRSYRRAAGLTQEELADRAQVSPREISDLERGVRNRPRRDTIQFLAMALHLEPADLAQFEAAARRPRPPSRAVGLANGPNQEVSIPRHRLPLQLTTFVGRERELGNIQRLLLDQDSPTRLITLTGAGGCGKTRLALKVSAEVLDRFFDGVWFVDLAPLNDPSLVPQAVAAALDLREESGRPMLDTLLEAFRSRHALLLLDNCEHLIDACARLVDDLLQNCVRVSILATSREILGVRGETAIRVPSLSLPDPRSTLAIEDIRESEAIRLFVDRARTIVPLFEITKENAGALAKVCVRLDGIPLAVELAAARVRVLTVEQIATRLDDRFRLLTGGSRTAMRRQQTLRALIDWSHDLLSAEEQVLFRQLAVFVGGWTLEAAEAVCSVSGLAECDVLDFLSSLVDKSLVVVGDQGEENRYHFLETVRAYAEEKLFDSGEAALIRGQHCAWCLGIAEPAEPELFGPDSPVWIGRLESDYLNIRAALEWCLETDVEAGLRLAGSLWWFWFKNDSVGEIEGYRWIDAMLARASEESPARAKALLGAGFLSRRLDPPGKARALTEQALSIARATEDRRLAGWALHNLGWIYLESGDRDSALAALEESLTTWQQARYTLGEGIGLRELGSMARDAGDTDRAAILFQESLAILIDVGDPTNIAWVTEGIADLARRQKDSERAKAALTEAMLLFRKDGSDRLALTVMLDLSELERSLGNFDQAAAYLRTGLVEHQTRGWTQDSAFFLFRLAKLLLRRGIYGRGVRLAGTVSRTVLASRNMVPEDLADHEALIQIAREALGGDTFAAAWAEGEAMTLDEAVAYALRDDAHA